jgi:hypothetical protein
MVLVIVKWIATGPVEVEEWVRTSYSLVAPKRLARQVLEQDRSTIR